MVFAVEHMVLGSVIVELFCYWASASVEVKAFGVNDHRRRYGVWGYASLLFNYFKFVCLACLVVVSVNPLKVVWFSSWDWNPAVLSLLQFHVDR